MVKGYPKCPIKLNAMSILLRVLSFKRSMVLSILLLLILIVLSFYGMYTNTFYFTKIDNYIFPILSLIHFTYIYVVWFKIKEKECPDPAMRNLEYVLYLVFLVYLFRLGESIYILSTYTIYQNHAIPTTFFPLGTVLIGSYILLLILAFITILHRKKQVGLYNFEQINDRIKYR